MPLLFQLLLNLPHVHTPGGPTPHGVHQFVAVPSNRVQWSSIRCELDRALVYNRYVWPFYFGQD
eukprot:2713137-Pyramimonas_sp.AAC.1